MGIKTYICIFSLFLACFSPSFVSGEIIRSDSPYYTSLYTVICANERGDAIKVGSGFSIVSKNAVFTANHVVKGCAMLFVFNGQEFGFHEVYVVRNDELYDLAILFPMNEDANFTGKFIINVVSPDLSDGTRVSVLHTKLSGVMVRYSGVIIEKSNRRKGYEADFYLIPGMSGSPVVNGAGEVIGMAVAIYTDTGHAQFLQLPDVK